MIFAEELLKSRSKEHRDKIIDYAGEDPGHFAELLDIMFHGEEPKLREYAAWAISHIGYNHPHLTIPHCAELIEVLKKKAHPAIHRGAVRVLQKVDLPEDLKGKAFDVCFDILCDMKRPIAVRVFSMTVVHNIAKEEPELMEELKIVLQELYEFGSTGFKARARKIIHSK